MFIPWPPAGRTGALRLRQDHWAAAVPGRQPWWMGTRLDHATDTTRAGSPESRAASTTVRSGTAGPNPSASGSPDAAGTAVSSRHVAPSPQGRTMTRPRRASTAWPPNSVGPAVGPTGELHVGEEDVCGVPAAFERDPGRCPHSARSAVATHQETGPGPRRTRPVWPRRPRVHRARRRTRTSTPRRTSIPCRAAARRRTVSRSD